MAGSSQKPPYEGSAPSQAALLQRREALEAKKNKALKRVNELVRAQQDISKGLSTELSAMKSDGQRLDALEASAGDQSLMATLSRAFTRRRAILDRRSVAEDLLRRYEIVSVQLRKATAFADELQLCSLELQEQVEGLHEELARNKRNARLATEHVLALEAELDQLARPGGAAPLSAPGDPAPGEPAPGDLAAEWSRRADQLRFQERTESTSLALYRSGVDLAHQELPPARALRDTVLELYDEMAQFVLKATASVNASGRRIQALGLAADAPLVVAELHQSLVELGTAMEATEAYIDQAQDLLVRVLPELSARIGAGAGVAALDLSTDLDDLSRERSRELADRSLREAADEEILELTRTL